MTKTDEARQSLCAARGGDHADLDLCKAEASRGRCDPYIAAQGDLQAATQRYAVDCRYDRLFTGLDAAKQLMGRLLLPMIFGRRKVPCNALLDVGAGAKGLFAGAG